MALNRPCSAEDCEKPAICRSMCRTHYNQARRSGPLDPVVKHSLSFIDAETKTAVCAICGPTAIRYRTDRASECRTKTAGYEGTRTYDSGERRDRWLRANFGITASEYETMLSRQDGGCVICGSVPQPGDRALAVDHCHSTGDVRGLLCGRCNTALGLLRERTDLMERAAQYLQQAAGTGP